ncbi:MAG TPA: SDR family NAD(P)-dependent oxidoreductase [Gemmatimonadaceae bacterium]|nr:SDR family NAD(P)-dependent oxidoreductase [Gemmatimonadaceae bacterium]
MRNVIVTGGSRGLGLGIVQRLRADGYQAIAVARRESEQLGAAMREEVLGDGAIRFRACDLNDLAAIPDLVKGIRKEYGAIYGLVNNAGIGTSGLLATMKDSDIESLIRLNTLSPAVTTKYVVRSMMAGGGGRIVNISSIVSATGYTGLSVYSATKASMIGFTRSLARELGPLGITVNAVAPGFIDTEMTGELGEKDRERIARRSALKRMASVSDVADAVGFLFGEGARNITGTTLTVDAGGTA